MVVVTCARERTVRLSGRDDRGGEPEPVQARRQVDVEPVRHKGERRLAENGHAERILELRHDYQQVMREDLVAIVERHLERKVIAFMSQNHIDPDLAVEVFVLEPVKAA